MNQQQFSLQPFGESLSNYQITGNIARIANQLSLAYLLVGDIEEIAIAAPSDTPSRKDELWLDTCFEFFIGVKNTAQYWEFNLSSSGDWNVYRFDDYRQGMEKETAFTKLPFIVQNLSDSLAIALDINLDQILTATAVLEVAITSVIKRKNGEVTYWALTHRGSQADFHRRDSFIIEL